MPNYYIHRVIKKKPTFGGEIEKPIESSTLANIEREEVNLSPLSHDTDPRVKKLKKALEGLAINPKPQRYIRLFTK